MKITKTKLQMTFALLCKTLDKEITDQDYKAGTWYLDYSPHLGGYGIFEIAKICDNSIFFHERLCAKTLYYSMVMTIRAIQQMQQKEIA